MGLREQTTVGQLVQVEYEITYIGHTKPTVETDTGRVESVKGTSRNPKADCLTIRQTHRTMGAFASHVISWNKVRSIRYL